MKEFKCLENQQYAVMTLYCEQGSDVITKKGIEICNYTETAIDSDERLSGIPCAINRFDYISTKTHSKTYGIDIIFRDVDEFFTYTVTSAEELSDETIINIILEIDED